jgi:hypothetical protein
MTYRRRHRWLRRFALGLAFATFAAPAAAKPDLVDDGLRYVTAGGWSGYVYADTGIPVSAGIPQGDEALIGEQSIEVIPYLSHGLLTESDQAAAAAEAIHDRYLASRATGEESVKVSPSILGEMVKSRQAPEPFIPGVTDFPKGTVVEEPQLLNHRQLETLADEYAASAAVRPDDRADRFTGIEQPQVVNYLSHGLAADGEVGARPDNKADRFAHSDVASSPQLASTGSSVDWNGPLTLGIGAVVLALALGLGLGFLKRPKIAGP